MKFYLIAVIFLLLYIDSKAQCTFAEYENYISENCLNCNQAEVNMLLHSKCLEVDTVLKSNEKRFSKKLIKNYNAKKVEKERIEKLYKEALTVLKNSRKKLYVDYENFTKEGNNNYYNYLFYWYYTDKINEILIDIETNLFGDIE